MSVIRISLNHQKHLEIAADLAVSYLRRGGIIIYPTETCYGIGADATNPDAVKKV
ncbi:MAG: threonylcarbamoyl-AMP synthase, partial [Candidatus Aenigmatarchaeota archaeon]